MATNYGVTVIDGKGRISWSNVYMRAFPKNKVLGRRLWDLADQVSGEKLKHLVGAARVAGEGQQVAATFISPIDHQPYEFDLVITPSRDGCVVVQWRRVDTIGLLSDIEKKILLMACADLSSKEIADKLDLSESGVSNHRRKIREKLNVKGVAGEVKYAIAMGWISPFE